MKVFYLKATGLVLEFDAEETKFGITILKQVVQLARNLSEIGMEEDEQFVFDLEAVYGDILEEEYASVN